MHYHNSLLGKLSVSYMIPLGEGSWMLAPGFLWTLPKVPFPFLNCVLYAFIVINHSHEYKYMLSPVSSQ